MGFVVFFSFFLFVWGGGDDGLGGEGPISPTSGNNFGYTIEGLLCPAPYINIYICIFFISLPSLPLTVCLTFFSLSFCFCANTKLNKDQITLLKFSWWD